MRIESVVALFFISVVLMQLMLQLLSQKYQKHFCTSSNIKGLLTFCGDIGWCTWEYWHVCHLILVDHGEENLLNKYQRFFTKCHCFMVVNTYFALTDPMQLLPRRLDDVSNFGALPCLKISWQKWELFPWMTEFCAQREFSFVLYCF